MGSIAPAKPPLCPVALAEPVVEDHLGKLGAEQLAQRIRAYRRWPRP
jgi:hypothetical protein